MSMYLAAIQVANILENANLPSASTIIWRLLKELERKDKAISDLTVALGKALSSTDLEKQKERVAIQCGAPYYPPKKD